MDLLWKPEESLQWGGIGEQSDDGHYHYLRRSRAPVHLPALAVRGGDGGGGAVRSVDGDNQVRPKGSLHDRGPKASVKGDSVLDVLGVKGLCTF